MTVEPIIIFDTSGLNKLADDLELACFEPALKSGFFIRLTETNVGEIIATPDNGRRQQLLQLCRHLVTAGDCIYPYHWIIRELVTAHHRKPMAFDWTTVKVRFRAAEKEIAFQEIINDTLATEQRDHARNQDREFAGIFDNARPHFDELFIQKVTDRPTDFRGLVTRLQGPSGAYWNFGKGFYERSAKIRPDEDTIRKFIDDCPPFRALILVVCIAQYERCIREMPSGESYRAGAFDLYSSVYLPYCHRFITADERQLNALRQVTDVGRLGSAVVSYDDFWSGLTVRAAAR